MKNVDSSVLKPEIKFKLGYGLAFLMYFYIFYGAASFLSDFTSKRYSVAFSWEKDIPFIPQTAWVYSSLSLLLVLCLFMIKDQKQLRRLFKILCAQVAIASLFFILFPIEKTFPSRYAQDDLPLIFLFADIINLNNNDFPSLHVCLAYTAVMIALKSQGLVISLIFYSWATMIAISTLLIHEHHLLDVIGGILLALLAVIFQET